MDLPTGGGVGSDAGWKSSVWQIEFCHVGLLDLSPSAKDSMVSTFPERATLVSRTLSLSALVRVSLRSWSVLQRVRLLRVSNADATVGPEVLVQRMDLSNIQLFGFCRFFKECT